MPGGRGNKAIETLDPDLRAKIDALIFMGTPVTEIYDSYPQIQSAMQLRTLQEYAKDLRDEQQLDILRSNKRVINKLLAEFDDEADGLSASELVALGTALKGMLGEGKTSTHLNAVDSYLRIRRDRREESAAAMASEKFEVWKKDYLRKERERIEAANRAVETVGRDEGLSDEAINRIRDLYGLPRESDDDGRTASEG